MGISEIQLGQVWRENETGENFLITKVYQELFNSYAVLRRVGDIAQDVRRVQVEKSPEGIALAGFSFAQESGSF